MRTQHNARIHAVATALAIGAGAFLCISPSEWCVVVPGIAAVWAAEAFNTAIEFLYDAAVPGHHPLVGRAKDLSAAAVLVAAVGAGAVGGLVFLPRILQIVGL